MEITDVKKHIMAKQILPFYCFTGEEVGIMNIYIHKIAEVLDAELVFADTVVSVIQKSSGGGLVKRRKVFVIHDDTDFIKQDKIIDDFINNRVLKSDVLILVLNSLDKRSMFYKTYNSSIYEFKHLNSENLSIYVKRKCALSDRNIATLVDICENDYSRILLEIDKIERYQIASKSHTDLSIDGAFQELLETGGIYCPPKDAIFDFVDAVLRRQVRQAYALLEDSYAIGEHVLALLSVLYTNAKQVLQVQACPKDVDTAQSTGLTAWQIKCASAKTGYFSNGDLVYLMRLIQDTEKQIKQGTIEEEYAVDYVLANFL